MTLPGFIYGTAWKEERTAELAALALKVGFRAIDTANQRKHYVEAAVGEAVAGSGVARGELFLQTKFTYARGQDHRLGPFRIERRPEINGPAAKFRHQLLADRRSDHHECDKRQPDREILQRTRDVLAQGASGIVYGRNVIQHPSPSGITRALMTVVHKDASVEDALALLKQSS